VLGGKGKVVEKLKKSFAASTRVEAVSEAEMWWAKQENVRRIEQLVIALGDRVEASPGDRWIVTITYEKHSSPAELFGEKLADGRES
jgi:hypothetical protein